MNVDLNERLSHEVTRRLCNPCGVDVTVYCVPGVRCATRALMFDCFAVYRFLSE